MYFKNFKFILLLALLTIFMVLSWYVSQYPVNQPDLTMAREIQKMQAPWLDRLMLGISIFGQLPYSLISVLAVAILFFKADYKREAFFIAQFVFSGLVILLVKNLINRPRPTEFYVRLVEINRFQSFPSGHVLSYTLLFGFLILLMRRLTSLPQKTRHMVTATSYFLILTIPISRIYLGAHWPSDTLGGMLLGSCYLLVVDFFYLKRK